MAYMGSSRAFGALECYPNLQRDFLTNDAFDAQMAINKENLILDGELLREMVTGAWLNGNRPHCQLPLHIRQ